MRVDQIRNLCWAANVLAFAAMGWVGFEFFEALERRGDVPECSWPSAEEKEVATRRWPGSVDKFTHIWKTPVNGLVPKPPVIEPPKPPKRDPIGDFKKAVAMKSGWLFSSDPTRTTLEIDYKGQRYVRLGEEVDGWLLVGYEYSEKDRKNVLTFEHREHGRVACETKDDATIPLVGDKSDLVLEPLDQDDAVAMSRVSRTKIEQRAFDPKGDGAYWYVPADEQTWWKTFGEDEVLKKLKTSPHMDQNGEPHGLKLLTTPGAGAVALRGERGLRKEDILKSINGVAVNSSDDVVAYLRGDGADAEYYTVIYERNGKERTVVYDVPRRRSRTRP